MKQFDFKMQSPVGIHARPAVLLVEKARTYQSKIILEKGTQRANAKNMISLLTLRARQHEIVTFMIEGPDEDRAAEELIIFNNTASLSTEPAALIRVLFCIHEYRNEAERIIKSIPWGHNQRIMCKGREQ